MAKTTRSKAASSSRPVLVCTEHRGVFYGRTSDPSDATTATLTGVRNALFWSTDVGGFLGLAETGPTKDCRIGARASGPVTLQSVTCIADVTPAAAEVWESFPCVK